MTQPVPTPLEPAEPGEPGESPEPAEPTRAPLAFGGVSCPAAAQCMAVGDNAIQEQPGTESGFVAEQESSAGWAVTPLPRLPGERYGGLSAVSCIAPDGCTAVGNANNGVGSTVEQLIEHWDGVSWAIQNGATP